MIPVTPAEWFAKQTKRNCVLCLRTVGISTDLHAFRLLEYLYRVPQKIIANILHEYCEKELAPSTYTHISGKLLQLAATNCTDGSHKNTRKPKLCEGEA